MGIFVAVNITPYLLWDKYDAKRNGTDTGRNDDMG